MAVITDLDLITNLSRFQSIVRALTDDDEIATRLVSLAKPIALQLKGLPPTISTSETRDILTAVTAAVPPAWTNGEDEPLRAKLSNVAVRLDRMRRIKRGGIFTLPKPIRRLTVELIREASSVGLFLVHVGELEEWLPSYNIKASRREDKAAWANEAAALLEREPPHQNDVWAFVTRVGQYLDEIGSPGI